MLNVSGSTSAKTGVAPVKRTALAEATNEKDEVTTSSPGPMPSACRQRCRPAVPLETATAWRTPMRSAQARSKRGPIGPSESWPERSTSSTSSRSRSPMTGLASGMRSSAGAQPGRGRGRGRARGPADAVLEAVEQRLPRCLDDVLADADRAPGVAAVAGVDEHARDRAGALGLVEDPHLEVDQRDARRARAPAAPSAMPQRGVERVDRAVALGGGDEALAAVEDLDRRLGLDAAVGALLGDDAEALEREERLVDAGLALHHQLERAVGDLEVVALVLELLQAAEDRRHPGLVVGEVHAQLARLGEDRAAARELGDQHPALVAHRRRVDVLVGAASAFTPCWCMPPLWANAFWPTYGAHEVGLQVGGLGHEAAEGRELGEALGRRRCGSPSSAQRRDDRDQVGVAAALAVAVDRALHEAGALLDRGEAVGDGALGVVVGVDARGPRRAARRARRARPGRGAPAAWRRWCRRA